MKPPYTITPKINSLCIEISRLIGKYSDLGKPTPKVNLRKTSQINSIQSTLAIEGNTLTLNQVTDIINDKIVKGFKKDIIEVKNAIKVYELLYQYKSNDVNSLLRAHKILMDGLLNNSGKWRNKNVGVKSQEDVIHKAPKYTFVPQLMGNLFEFLKQEKDLHPLIKSSIFHYEFEFIHPFLDGNGRIGRLWQSVILYEYDKIFQYIPIETIIKKRQQDYYRAIQESTNEGESTAFVEYMLEVIQEAVTEFTDNIKPSNQSVELRLVHFRKEFGKNLFRRKDYMGVYADISVSTASKDLTFGVESGILERTGETINTRYRFR